MVPDSGFISVANQGVDSISQLMPAGISFDTLKLAVLPIALFKLKDEGTGSILVDRKRTGLNSSHEIAGRMRSAEGKKKRRKKREEKRGRRKEGVGGGEEKREEEGKKGRERGRRERR